MAAARRRVVAGFAIALALGACAPAPLPEDEGALPVWPSGPDAPRVAFVKTFSRPEHLGIGK